MATGSLDAMVATGLWRTQMFEALNTPLESLLGQKTAQAFRPLKVQTIGDLLKHVPRRYLTGTELTDLASLESGDHVAVIAKVRNTEIKFSKSTGRGGANARLEVVLTDGRGTLGATFFGRDHICKWWDKQLQMGVRGIFVGKVGQFNNRPQMTHPEFVMLDASGHIVGRSEEKELMATVVQQAVVALYPATAKLPTWKIADCVRLGMERIHGLPDPWPDWVRAEATVPNFEEAVRFLHAPTREGEPEEGERRLRFDEALATQLTMSYRRADTSRHTAIPRPRTVGGLLDAFDAKLPYQLTEGQLAVADQLFADLDARRPMQRLLQGEVGSGKTVVALRAMLTVVDNGGQAVLLAPTEVLAGQHHHTIRGLLGELADGPMLGAADATDVVLLTGSLPAAAKRAAMDRIASGEAGIIIGTHALLTDRVRFHDLGMVVIDEQHRFGVEQRASLAQRSDARPHVLVLTATPIPRSVAMTIFGDLDVSTLTEVPAGRQEVSTVVVDAATRPAWVERAWQRVREEVAQGRQVFVVAPRIGPAVSSNTLEPTPGVEELYAQLSANQLAGLRVGMLHGQLNTEAKEGAMAAFAGGALDVLVATTMIEVGVDVPNATMMVIHDAERFGISQLHQLRGRIGRGEHPGVCLLITHAEPGTDARLRLDAVAATRDGFALAELDLAQRREGDVLGADQSGSRSSLRLLRVLEDAELIGLARRIADEAVRRDPDQAIAGFADAVTQTERMAAADWLEGT